MNRLITRPIIPDHPTGIQPQKAGPAIHERIPKVPPFTPPSGKGST